MARDDTDPRLWQDAIALFERLRDLDPAAAAEALAAAPGGVRERVQRMQRADAGSGPLDQRLPDAGAPEQLGRWRIGPVLGRGGMSVVYRARSTVAPEEQVAAVKLLALPTPDAPAMARFEREINILAQLRHPGIASLYDAGVAPDGRPWFAMALVEGEPIDAWCRRTRPGLAALAEGVAAVADAVAHAHRHLVVHRDIKPGNVMVDAEGHVVLLDFGISRVLEAGASELTHGGNYPFTPRYAAPEQREGRGISTATDVYGLGALLHALVFDAAPAWPPGQGEVVLPAAPALPDDLQQVLAKALLRDPAQRYAGAAAFADDLRAWRSGHPVQARRGGRGYRLARWLQRNPVPTALAGALVLSLLAGTAISLWQAGEARAQAQAAQAAQAEAEQSRQSAERERDRAEALNRFVLGLFSAQLPNRPRDELPTTAELLDLGVERARDPASGEPALRAQMLSAIANVFQTRARADEAAGLIAEAVALARQDQALAPTILVQALRRQASFAMARGDFALADAALAEAIPIQAALEGDAPPGPDLLGLRRTRAMALAARQDYAGAVGLFEAIHRDVVGRDDLPAGVAARAGADLAVIYSSVGRYADALPFSEAAVAAAEASGARDVGAAIVLSNNARLRMYQGDFIGAHQRIEAALAIHDRLFDAPSSARAAARFNLGRLLAREGKFDAALVALDAASEEWARADGEDPG
ncbi:MAG TPA: serine/threonine-protein kinase, partial [Arenimonas sp.]|uniref:serine/threonine-protein kinase n=1 Tax=Arenimonas sp. TaxID=1872635 RepID=UPI002D7F5F1C